MTLEELTPSDEDKPYVTESEEDTVEYTEEEDVTDKEMRSNLKRKKLCKTFQKIKTAKPSTTPKHAVNKKARKTKTTHDKTSTTSQQETPQCMLP